MIKSCLTLLFFLALALFLFLAFRLFLSSSLLLLPLSFFFLLLLLSPVSEEFGTHRVNVVLPLFVDFILALLILREDALDELVFIGDLSDNSRFHLAALLELCLLFGNEFLGGCLCLLLFSGNPLFIVLVENLRLLLTQRTVNVISLDNLPLEEFVLLGNLCGERFFLLPLCSLFRLPLPPLFVLLGAESFSLLSVLFFKTLLFGIFFALSFPCFLSFFLFLLSPLNGIQTLLDLTNTFEIFLIVQNK